MYKNKIHMYSSILGLRALFVFLLIVLATLLETLGIAMIFPVFAIIIDFEDNIKFENNGFLNYLNIFIEYISSIYESDSNIEILLFMLIFIFSFKSFIIFMAQVYRAKLSAKLGFELREKIFYNLCVSQSSLLAKYEKGFYLNMISTRVDEVISAFDSLIAIFSATLRAIVFGFVGFLTSPIIGLFGLIIGGFYFSLTSTIGKKIRKLSSNKAKFQERFQSVIIQNISAIKYLKSTGRLDFFAANFFPLLEKLKLNYFTSNILLYLVQSFKEPFMVISLVFLVWIDSSFNNSPIILSMVPLLLFYKALNSLTTVNLRLQSFFSYSGGVDYFVNSLSKLGYSEKPKNSAEIFGSRDSSYEISVGGDSGVRIKATDIEYSYVDQTDKPLFKISFVFEPNTVTLVTGPSGSGKSTLCEILVGLKRPTGGVLEYYLSDVVLCPKSLPRVLGYVSQSSVVFPATVAENIALTSLVDLDASILQRVNSVLIDVGLREWLSNLPNGLSTLIDEDGLSISGGQRQRLMIARELFKRPKLLVLDEPTSALDSVAQDKLISLFQRLKTTTTLVVISHRLEVSDIADAHISLALESSQNSKHA